MRSLTIGFNGKVDGFFCFVFYLIKDASGLPPGLPAVTL